MKIAVPKEIKNHEYRVALTPTGARELAGRGHQVSIQAGAGEGAGFSDADFQAAGAQIEADVDTLWRNAELILKVKEPQPDEVARLTPQHTLFTYLHLAAEESLTRGLMESGATCIAYETITDTRGGLPLLAEELASADARNLRQDLRELFDSLVRGGEPVGEAARLDAQALDRILWYGIAWLEDLIRLGLSGDPQRVRNSDLLPLYRQAVKNARVRDWFRLLDYAREQRRLLAAGGNPNPQLVLEAWLVRWAALLRS